MSVLVAAWNEADHIRDHINSFLDLKYLNKELILCAGGMDGTYEIARQLQSRRVKVIEQLPGEGKQRALRRCLEYAQGEIIFLTDADCLLNNHAFERTLAPIIDDDERVTSGWVKPFDEQIARPFIEYHWLNQQYWISHSSNYISGLEGRNAGILRRALEDVGSFNDDVATGTDFYLANLLISSGYKIKNIPSSRISTEYPESLVGYWNQKSRWARNNLLHGLNFGLWDSVKKELRAGVSGAFIVAVPFTLGGLSPFLWAIWGIGVFHLTLVRLRQATLAVSQNGKGQYLPGRYISPMIAFLFVDSLASTRALIECLIPYLRKRW